MLGGLPLRDWQIGADREIESVLRRGRSSAVIHATMGAGKTHFGGHVFAKRKLGYRSDFRIIVTPTRTLKGQWATSMRRFGINIKHDFQNKDRFVPRDFDGVAATYAQVAADPALFAHICDVRRADVALDEIHHLGLSLAWGNSAERAFGRGEFVLGLSGTPFRADDNRIPFLRYVDGYGVPDYEYTYTNALDDEIVRPVVFIPYVSNFRFKAFDELQSIDLGDLENTRAQNQIGLDLALNPKSAWMTGVIRDAHALIVQIRQGMPDAAVMLIARDVDHAERCAKRVQEVTGVTPKIIVSDESKTTTSLDDFARGSDPWLVSVRMVSEGANIPRLIVGIFATNYTSPLFFEQWVGRYTRRTPLPATGQVAYCFIPALPELIDLAKQIENERRHAVSDAELREMQREARERDDPQKKIYVLVDSSGNGFDDVVYRGKVVQPSLFGDIPLQVLQTAVPHDPAPPAPVADVGRTEQRQVTVREIRRLATILKDRTGRPHSHIYQELKQLNGGKAQGMCTINELQQRIVWLQNELRKIP